MTSHATTTDGDETRSQVGAHGGNGSLDEAHGIENESLGEAHGIKNGSLDEAHEIKSERPIGAHARRATKRTTPEVVIKETKESHDARTRALDSKPK